MNTNKTIRKIDTINDYKIDDTLKQKLAELEWRFQSNHFTELFAQISADTVTGIGMSWTSAFHPYAKYIDVIAKDAADELMNHLLAGTATHDKIILSCWDYELEKIQLLEQFQFKLFRKTYMETYEISPLLKQFKQEQSTQTLIPLLEILNEPTFEQNLFQLLKSNYEQTHLDNRVKDVPWQTWKEILMDDTPDLHLSFAAVEEKNVTAYIFLHPISTDHYEIGWVGMKNPTNLLPILKQQLILLQRQGVKTVEFEIDTTNDMAWQFAELLQLDQKNSWNSYYLDTK